MAPARCPRPQLGGVHRGGVTLALGLALLGCPAPDLWPDSDPEPEPELLAAADGWTRVVEPSEDWFADQRPDDAVCDDLGWFVDPISQTLEIETEVCDYPTLRQETLVALAPGDRISVAGFHDALTAPEPSQGYVGLALAGEIVWEYTVEIPADANLFDGSIVVDREVPAGTELQLHVHNHGPNTWQWTDVLARAQE